MFLAYPCKACRNMHRKRWNSEKGINLNREESRINLIFVSKKQCLMERKKSNLLSQPAPLISYKVEDVMEPF